MTMFLIFLSLLYSATCLESSSEVWTWKCEEAMDDLGPKCVRHELTPGSTYQPMSSCLLTCGDAATLFPRPANVSLGKDLVRFLPSSITHLPSVCQDTVCTLLSQAVVHMIYGLDRYHPSFREVAGSLWESQTQPDVAHHKVVIDFKVSGVDEYLTLTTDESYSLTVSTEGSETTVVIVAPTFFGARHALETLIQLMDYDKDSNALMMVSSASIKDQPAFPHRGLLIDTSRNFFSVQTLKRILDGMSYNKLNVFHWHISDSQSFPLKLKSLPKMAMYGAYSPEEVYTADDVKELVQYARVRGIRILPEFDAPAHVGHGWQWGPKEGLGELVVCLDKQPWPTYCAGPPCGQMNLANPNLYVVLEKLYKELVEMFSPIEMFHYGGDEIKMSCWNSSAEITEWMTSSGYGLSEEAYFEQWSVFQEKAHQLLKKSNHGKEVPGILWTSSLTEKSRAAQYLPKDQYIIQIWTAGDDPQIKELLESGFKLIISNYDSLYLDCGVASWVGKGTNWCSPYKGWQDIYDNDIAAAAQNITNSELKRNILGGEVAAWSEQIDETTIDAKLWPRGAALAERLWSNPSGNFSLAKYRMVHHRQRLVQRGLKAARLVPEWCRQNAGQCGMPWQPPKEEEEFNAEAMEQNNEELYNRVFGTSTSSRSFSEVTNLYLFYVIIFNVVGTFLY